LREEDKRKLYQISSLGRKILDIELWWIETGELDEEVVIAKIATTTQHGAMQDKTQTNFQ
jgi:hypothetical protein